MIKSKSRVKNPAFSEKTILSRLTKMMYVMLENYAIE
jgi:hypothetical protein